MGGFTDTILQWLLPTPITPSYISESLVHECLRASDGHHPNEFLALLTAEHSSKIEVMTPNISIDDEYIITSYYVIPGTESTPISASFESVSVPVTTNICGSFHSHPNGVPYPSQEDERLFQKYPVNIIAASPFSMSDWNAFGPNAQQTTIDVIKVKDPPISNEWNDELR